MTNEIEIFVNGKRYTVSGSVVLLDVLRRLEYKETQIAVAVNEEFVSRSQYQQWALADADRLDIVSAVEGG